MSKHLLILGCGYSGKVVARKLRTSFDTISGTCRNKTGFDAIKDAGATPLVFGGETVSKALRDTIKTVTHLLVSIAPDESGDPVLAKLGEEIAAASKLQSIIYLSTVGVYGNHEGRWVNEKTQPHPLSKRSVARFEAETAWQDFSSANKLPLAIFRLSGIYGPSRNAFVNIKKGRSRRLVKPGQVFNRIHVEDIAKAVELGFVKKAEGIFNITDDEPAPPQDVVMLAHQLVGSKPPPEIDFETADLTPMQRSFYSENKQVSNARSKEVLGLNYQWPNYRMALEKMWREDRWL